MTASRISLVKHLRQREIPAMLSHLASVLRGEEVRLKLVSRGRYRKDDTRHRRYEGEGATARQVVTRSQRVWEQNGKRHLSQRWEMEVETPIGTVAFEARSSGWDLKLDVGPFVEGATPAQLDCLQSALRDHANGVGWSEAAKKLSSPSRPIPKGPPARQPEESDQARENDGAQHPSQSDAETLEKIRAFVEEREGWSVKRRSCAECKQAPTKKKRSDGRWKSFRATAWRGAHLAPLLVAMHPRFARESLSYAARERQLLFRCPDCGALYLFDPDDEDTLQDIYIRMSADDAINAAARWVREASPFGPYRIWHVPSGEPITE